MRFYWTLPLLFLFLASPARAGLEGDVSQKYSRIKTWQAQFTQSTHVEMLGQNLEKSGSIKVSRPNKIRIEYFSEPKKIYSTNGKKLWVYRPDEIEAYEFKDPDKILNREALSFLGGLMNMQEIFDILADLKEPTEGLKIKDSTLSKLSLIPRDQSADILRIILGVDKKTTTVKEAILYNQSGNVTHYIFENINFDGEVSDMEFELPKTPKRKIISDE